MNKFMARPKGSKNKEELLGDESPKAINGVFENDNGYEAVVNGVSVSKCEGDKMYCFTGICEEYKRKRFF